MRTLVVLPHVFGPQVQAASGLIAGSASNNFSVMPTGTYTIMNASTCCTTLSELSPCGRVQRQGVCTTPNEQSPCGPLG
eukprot:351944-Chlamydomonas_euryale.AAC.2